MISTITDIIMIIFLIIFDICVITIMIIGSAYIVCDLFADLMKAIRRITKEGDEE